MNPAIRITDKFQILDKNAMRQADRMKINGSLAGLNAKMVAHYL